MHTSILSINSFPLLNWPKLDSLVYKGNTLMQVPSRKWRDIYTCRKFLFNKLSWETCSFSFLRYPWGLISEVWVRGSLASQYTCSQYEPVCSQQWQLKKYCYTAQNVSIEIEYKLPTFQELLQASPREGREEGVEWGGDASFQNYLRFRISIQLSNFLYSTRQQSSIKL